MIFLHLFVCQNPQQERGGALLFLPAPGEFWTRYGPAAFIFSHLKGFFIFMDTSLMLIHFTFSSKALLANFTKYRYFMYLINVDLMKECFVDEIHIFAFFWTRNYSPGEQRQQGGSKFNWRRQESNFSTKITTQTCAVHRMV